MRVQIREKKMHYVIGDVHGCYEDCMRLIKKIEREDNYARFIFIGDVIDRGPDSVKMLRWCMEHVKEGGKYQMLMGNHELMFMEWCSSQWFPYCEGKETSYKHAYYNTDEDLELSIANKEYSSVTFTLEHDPFGNYKLFNIEGDKLKITG